MTLLCRNLVAGVFAFLVVIAQPAAAAQETYPSRPIRVVIPFPPGGASDTLTRIVTTRISAKFGQPIVIDHRPGATGNIGAELVANARPDGYTLLSTPPPPLVINQSLFARLAFDPAKFVPITVIASAPNVLVAHPRLSSNSVTELIAQAKAQPRKINYASTGIGGTPHLTAEWLKHAAGIQITHVPYKGALAYTAVMAGEADVMFMNLGDALPHVRAEKLKVLAVASAKPVAAFPGAGAIADTIPGFASSTWFGITATQGTPPAVADKLSRAINEVLRLPEVTARFGEMYFEAVGGSSVQTVLFFREEAARWAKVIRAADIKAD